MGYDTCFTWTHLKGLFQSKIQFCVIDEGDTAKMRKWLDSTIATIQLETIIIIDAFTAKSAQTFQPFPLVPLSVMRMNFDSPQIFLNCVGYQQYY